MSINENNDLQKNELIAKLESLSSLRKKVLSIKSKMDNFTPDDHYERSVTISPFSSEYDDDAYGKHLIETIDHTRDNAVDLMSAEYDKHYAPKKPKKPIFDKEPDAVTAEVDKFKKKFGAIALVAIFLGALSLLSAFTGTFANWLFTAICAGVVAYYYYTLSQLEKKDANAFAELKQAHSEAVAAKKEEYEKALAEYENEYKLYQLRLYGFLDEYKEWRNIHLQSLEEEELISQKLEADRQAAVKKIEAEELLPAVDEFAQFNENLITNNYINSIDIFIDLLKSGRADNLKEAINRYEEMVYREKQLQLQREQEAQRQYEEARRRADEERHYQEQMKFQQQQERRRQYEVDKQMRMQEQQHKENMELQKQMERDRQYEERRRSEEDRRKREREALDRKMEESRETSRQCNTCALNGHCSMAYRRPNCASFKPR